MNRIFSISNRSRSYKAARTVLDGGANELRVVFSGRGAPSCELAIVWFFRQGPIYRGRRMVCQEADSQFRLAEPWLLASRVKDGRHRDPSRGASRATDGIGRLLLSVDSQRAATIGLPSG